MIGDVNDIQFWQNEPPGRELSHRALPAEAGVPGVARPGLAKIIVVMSLGPLDLISEASCDVLGSVARDLAILPASI
jgi:hypothetical protein